jgi:hypothetical protein
LARDYDGWGRPWWRIFRLNVGLISRLIFHFKLEPLIIFSRTPASFVHFSSYSSKMTKFEPWHLLLWFFLSNFPRRITSLWWCGHSKYRKRLELLKIVQQTNQWIRCKSLIYHEPSSILFVNRNAFDRWWGFSSA